MAGNKGGHQAPRAQPLHDAARAGDVDAIRRLLKEDPASLDERDRHSRTPLHLAAWAGQTEAVKVLCENEADVAASAGDDMAAVHFASQKGHTQVVRLLLAAGAHVNTSTRKGMSPLHYAVQGGNADLTQLLIKRGANLQSTTKAGKRPIDLAKDEDFKSLVRTAESERQALRNAKTKPNLKAAAQAKAAEVRSADLENADVGTSAVQDDLVDAKIVGPQEKEYDGIEVEGRKREFPEDVKKDHSEGKAVEEEATMLSGPRKKKSKVALSHLDADEAEEEVA